MAHRPLTTKFNKLKAEISSFFRDDGILAERAAPSSGFHGFVLFCMRVARNFVSNRCPTRAAALAFTTVLALVPMLAVALSVSTAFAQKDAAKLKDWVYVTIERTAPQLREVKGLDEAIKTIFESIENFRSAGLGVASVLVLIFVAISLLSNIETAFNDIWGSSKGRSWSSRVVQYWAAISLGPMFLLAAAGVTTSSRLPQFQEQLNRLATEYGLVFVAELIGFGVTYFLPFLIMSTLLTAIYVFLPNAKVDWRAAWVGGLVAGALVQLNSTFSIIYASRVARDKSIYGGLATVPLFLLGLYISWLIILFGAQVAYSFQNRRSYIKERQADNLDQRGREFIALRIMTCIAQCFHSGSPPPTTTRMADAFGVPDNVVRQILGLLLDAKLVVEAIRTEQGYVPARPLTLISAHDVLHAMRVGAKTDFATCLEDAPQVLQDEYAHIESAEREVGCALTLQVLVDRSGSTRST